MKQVRVMGMSCAHCVAAVKSALEGLGLRDVAVNLEEGLATFSPSTQVSYEALKTAVDDAGFEIGEVL